MIKARLCINIKLTIAYDGTSFLGWQKTKQGNSIEQSLEKGIFSLLKEQVTLQTASRTDRGVHAKEQIVNFFTHIIDLDLLQFQRKLNAILAPSIFIAKVESIPLSFHPTLDCIGKEYQYFICNASYQLPFNRLFSWHVPIPLDIALMEQAATFFIGKHDFSTFCNQRKNLSYENKIRMITLIKIEAMEQSRIKFIIIGKDFLYKMVRNIVGTLIFVGKNRLSPFQIPHLLRAKQRIYAAMTAPAHGLFLTKVFYPEKK